MRWTGKIVVAGATSRQALMCYSVFRRGVVREQAVPLVLRAWALVRTWSLVALGPWYLGLRVRAAGHARINV